MSSPHANSKFLKECITQISVNHSDARQATHFLEIYPIYHEQPVYIYKLSVELIVRSELNDKIKEFLRDVRTVLEKVTGKPIEFKLFMGYKHQE
jgi:hypothetical protein